MTLMRKVIQIQVVSDPEADYKVDGLYALCDDGSIWHCSPSLTGFRESTSVWKRIPDPPEKATEDPEPL